MIAWNRGRAVKGARALMLALAPALTVSALLMGSSFAATRNVAKASAKAEDPQQAHSRQTAERARLVERIATLKKEIAAGERSRAGTAAALARAEHALATVDQRLEQLAAQRRGLQVRIVDLDQQRLLKESERVERQAELARTVTALAANRDRNPFQLYWTGRDPNGVMLDDAYLGYIARAEVERIVALRGHVSQLQEQKQRADAQNRALAQQAEAQKAARESLVADQSTQRSALAALSQKIAEQRKSASALQSDEQRLSRVVVQLQREIDRRAAQELAQREASRRRADQQSTAAARRKNDWHGSAPRSPEPVSPSSRGDAGPDVARDSVPEASSATGDFARQRGRLRLPVRGSLVARFGAPRGEGGASWKGVFIRTDAGAEVRAVSAGRVVFADYLRGFGNLLIVDHGDQYLSIYGNNETLKKRAGDTVNAGDVVSVSGNSSGDDQTGLYFELRFRGKPFDPMGWVGAR